MIHYGDITKISGYDVPIVDVVTFGAPCQDLSVAGKREGMKHTDMGDDETTRSGLFHEAIRIIKEMRDKDAQNGRSAEFLRPRFAVYENVPGAFSSNKGQDFKIVLESLVKIIEKDAVIPMPPKNKWSTSGAIMGDGWSIAWRILDAQFWGVPQRRRRIALVADFGGGCAPEILFERKSLRGYSEESRTERKSASSDAQGCIGVHDRDGKCITLEPGIASREGGHIYEDVSGTLRANAGDNQMSVAYSINQQGGSVEQIIEDKTGTLTASMNSSGNNRLSVACVYDARGNGNGDVCCTLTGDHQNRITDYSAVVCEPVKCYDIGDRRSVANESVDVAPTLLSKMGTGGNNVPIIMEENPDAKYLVPEVVEGLDCYNQTITGDKTMTLTNCATDPHHIPCVVMDRSAYNQGANAKFNIGIDENGVAFSCIAKGPGAVCYIDTSHADDVVRTDDVVAPLQARDYKGGKLIAMAEEEPVICLQGNGIDRADTAGCNGKGWKEGTCYTLNTVDRPAICYRKPHYIVRRLTPLECERLQGFADGWTDIGEYTDSKGKKKKTSDSARYKALGNSIALPPWKWVIKRLCSHYERDVTLASLFDGIGGFPCLWEQINGKGTALWASEIEDFPIAVTKARIE